MSKDIGPELPDDLFEVLSKGDVSHQNNAIVVVTLDAEGWPHPAMLSYREVTARDRNTLRVVSYYGSRTTGNIRRNGIVTLVFVDERMMYYVKGSGQEVTGARRDASPHYATLDVTIRQVLQDFVGADEEGAYVTSGITFFNPNR